MSSVDKTEPLTREAALEKALRMFIAWEEGTHRTSPAGQHDAAMKAARAAIAIPSAERDIIPPIIHENHEWPRLTADVTGMTAIRWKGADGNYRWMLHAEAISARQTAPSSARPSEAQDRDEAIRKGLIYNLRAFAKATPYFSAPSLVDTAIEAANFLEDTAPSASGDTFVWPDIDSVQYNDFLWRMAGCPQGTWDHDEMERIYSVVRKAARMAATEGGTAK